MKKVGLAKAGHISLIITAQKDGQATLLPHLFLQISNKGATYALALVSGMHGERMQLPGKLILTNGPDPTQDSAIIGDNHTADSTRCE
jgi:hypothetical protein